MAKVAGVDGESFADAALYVILGLETLRVRCAGVVRVAGEENLTTQLGRAGWGDAVMRGGLW